MLPSMIMIRVVSKSEAIKGSKQKQVLQVSVYFQKFKTWNQNDSYSGTD